METIVCMLVAGHIIEKLVKQHGKVCLSEYATMDN